MGFSKLKKAILAPTLVATVFGFISCGSERQKSGDLFSDLDKDRNPSSESGDSASADTGGEDHGMLGKLGGGNKGIPSDMEATTNVDPTVLPDSKPAADNSAATLEASAPEAAPANDASKLDLTGLPPAENNAAAVAQAVPSPDLTTDQITAVGAPSTAPELMSGKELTAAAPGALTGKTVAAVKKAVSKKGARVKTAQVSGMKTPVVPTESIWRKGQSLNRFYFLRSNDTPDTVASIVYGDVSKASQLADLNPDEWKAGNLIFYSSPDQPMDGQMKSLFEERQIPPSNYTVSKGDKIQSIADTIYGSPQSWKEIAVLNKLEKPASLAKGQQLVLYPAQVAARVATLNAPVVPDAPKVASADDIMKPGQPSAIKPDIAASALRSPNAQKPSGKVNLKHDEDLASAEDVGSFFEDHLVGIIAAMVLLMGGFVFYAKMRKSREYLD